jgi:NADPH2:quinone reductase
MAVLTPGRSEKERFLLNKTRRVFMVRAVRLDRIGGPEVMQMVDVELGDPGPGEVRVQHHAIGLNYIDIYGRTGLYPMTPPSGLGLEAAGVVEAIGPGVLHVAVGDRVAYAGGPLGAYSDARIMPAKPLVKLPDNIAFETAASMMLKGMTVQYLLRRTFPVQAGQTILFHAAAGGVGLIAMQWARKLGVTIIGTVGSDEKAELARAHGCHHTIVYTRENFVERTKELTQGRGVDVVYDSIGKDTFDGSLDCLRKYGTMVSFGNASGPVPPVALTKLKGHLFLTRPSLMPHTETREELDATAGELFEQVSSGDVKIRIDQRLPFAQIQHAHAELEARRTTGSTVLIP